MSNLEKEKELKKMNFKINIVIYMLILNSVSLFLVKKASARQHDLLVAIVDLLEEITKNIDRLIKISELVVG